MISLPSFSDFSQTNNELQLSSPSVMGKRLLEPIIQALTERSYEHSFISDTEISGKMYLHNYYVTFRILEGKDSIFYQFSTDYSTPARIVQPKATGNQLKLQFINVLQNLPNLLWGDGKQKIEINKNSYPESNQVGISKVPINNEKYYPDHTPMGDEDLVTYSTSFFEYMPERSPDERFGKT